MYAFDHRAQRKYYLRIVHDLMDTTVVNSNVIFTKIMEEHKEKKLSHLEFRQRVVRGLLASKNERYQDLGPGNGKQQGTSATLRK